VRVEEIRIPAGSPLAGRSLADSALLDVEGVTVVAISDGSGSYRFNPSRRQLLAPGDVVIVMGIVENILKLQARAGVA
jgi:voltage-gated potassium channel